MRRTHGTTVDVYGEPIEWELVEGLWRVSVLAMTREHAISLAVEWSTRTGRGADDEILSAEELPDVIDSWRINRDEAREPNWLVVIGPPPPSSSEKKRDVERVLWDAVVELAGEGYDHDDVDGIVSDVFDELARIYSQ